MIYSLFVEFFDSIWQFSEKIKSLYGVAYVCMVYGVWCGCNTFCCNFCKEGSLDVHFRSSRDF